MRRLIYLLLLVLFVSASATGVNASTDCERWFVGYRSELAHSRSVQRIAAAKRRARLYARRKLAGYVPRSKPKLVLASHPRMTRKETLHHFNLACGILPEDSADEPNIAEETPAPFVEHPLNEHALNDEIGLLPAALGDMIAENDVPLPPAGGGPPAYPSSGGPPVYVPPFTGGVTPSGGTPGTGTTVPPNSPGTPGIPPATPVLPDVPEPASYVLLLTGMAGAAGALQRRFKA
jgi:hypothetical protein